MGDRFLQGGGTITASVDGPGGPVLAGDHLRRDRCRYLAQRES